ncbi:MAG: carotenoid biosynthesis protein [Caldilineaceae bacterium]|nr:carotenoid biosynthesis protein [Caldilineaceae bacterium]
MANGYFVSFDVVMVSLLALCLVHAWRSGGAARSWALLAGVLFGLLLEWATIQQLHAYTYGRFPLMIAGEVPVAIGIGWGVILYSAQRFSQATSLPHWLHPVLNGLLALNIDLSMDAIAIRLGFWDWGQGLDSQYFGVPYANFWAWFWVVFSFSWGLQLLADRPHWAGRWLGPLGAILVGVGGVLITNYLITFVVPRSWSSAAIALTLSAALVLVLVYRPRLHVHPVPALVFWVPFAFHLYFLVTGLLSGALLAHPFLLIVSLVMTGLVFWLHWPGLARAESDSIPNATGA